MNVKIYCFIDSNKDIAFVQMLTDLNYKITFPLNQERCVTCNWQPFVPIGA